MAKINLGNGKINTKTFQNTTAEDQGNSVLSIISTGLQDVRALTDIFDSVSSTVEKRKMNDADIAVKLRKADTDAQKEKNRHEVEMEKIEQEWKKISAAAEDRDKRLLFLQGFVERFQADYDNYLNMDINDFMSPKVTTSLESLRKQIIELIKELNRE